MYDAMRTTTQWASAYFILLMILGNYILFNLLVAILVEGFSTDAVSSLERYSLTLIPLFCKPDTRTLTSCCMNIYLVLCAFFQYTE